MTISVVSRIPEIVPHKVIKEVVSFIITRDGVSLIRKITLAGSLASEWFPFGSVYVGVSYDENSD